MNRSAVPTANEGLTDEELDRNWKPSGRRPQSTIARSFSQELMDIFRIENSVTDLDSEVERRKWQISTQNHELEALEARIREMEQRLRSQSTTTAPNLAALTSGGAQPQEQRSSPATSPRHARAPVGNAFPAPEGSQQADDRAARRPAPLPKDQAARQYHGGGGSRPGTGRAGQQAVPGALPPTPVASEDGDDGEHEA